MQFGNCHTFWLTVMLRSLANDPIAVILCRLASEAISSSWDSRAVPLTLIFPEISAICAFLQFLTLWINNQQVFDGNHQLSEKGNQNQGIRGVSFKSSYKFRQLPKTFRSVYSALAISPSSGSSFSMAPSSLWSLCFLLDFFFSSFSFLRSWLLSLVRSFLSFCRR